LKKVANARYLFVPPSFFCQDMSEALAACADQNQRGALNAQPSVVGAPKAGSSSQPSGPRFVTRGHP
jgi:hypothetical protein